jgi:hypothetical protein
MLTKSKIILAAALLFGTATVALASDHEDQSGGFVNWPSLDGVNPAYHPGWFPNYAQGGKAYGLVLPGKHQHRSTR